MDILKRELAPVAQEAWQEIDRQATLVLQAYLSVRKFVDVIGPNGWDYAAAPLGRLDVPKNQKPGEVQFGIHAVQPLVEARAPFNLDVWELDNIIRGAKDIELKSLEEATKKIAIFEENAIFNSFKPGNIVGLSEACGHKTLGFARNPTSFLDALSQAVGQLIASSIGGPYALVVNPKTWQLIASYAEGFPLQQHVKELLEGPVIYSLAAKDAYLVSMRGGDLELTIGQDFAVGYQSHTNTEVTLFITESFTFRALEPAAFIHLAERKK
jgi:uncharacterized linocin/CFP29 family protein